MSQMDLSIVIVSWNTRELLSDCIGSIKNNCDGLYCEIIVVDNASTDDTIDVLKTKYPDVKLIRNQKNLGFSTANNQGFHFAQGRYILILNPDTIVFPKTLSYLVSALDEDKTIGAITAKVIWPDGSVQRSCARKEMNLWNFFCDQLGIARLFPNIWALSGTQLPYKLYDVRRKVAVISGAFMMVRRDILTRIGGFDEEFFFAGDDVDLSYRIRREEYDIIYEPSVQIVHIGGQSQKLSQIRIRKESLRGIFLFFKKHYPHTPIFVLRSIIFIRLIIIMFISVVLSILKNDGHFKDNLLVNYEALKWLLFESWKSI